jgi:predicted nucleic acid-binding protein
MEKEIVICDTNVFIKWFYKDKETIGILNEIGLNKIGISVISMMELYIGTNNKTELKQLEKRLMNYYIFEINTNISKIATEIVHNFTLSHGAEIPDALIGATALFHNLKLFTYNLKDFKYIPDIKLYEYDTNI